jgi:hypothetical protein
METGNEAVGSLEQMYQGLGMEPPRQETPPTEPQGQEPVEPQGEPQAPTEAPPQAPTEPAGEPSSPQPTETVFEINDFNQRFSTEFKDETDLKLAFDSLKRVKELEEQVKEAESLKEENLLLKENLDPMKYFKSEDDYKVAQFERQFPDKNGAVAYQLFKADLSQLSDKDAVAYEMMLDTPGLTKEKAMAVIDRQYGIEDGEMDEVAEAQLAIKGKQAIRSITALKNQITLPDKVDVNTLAQQQKELREQKTKTLSEQWGNIAKEVSKSIPDVEITDKDPEGNDVSFKYSITKDVPADVIENMVNYMAQSGVELNEDAVKVVGETLKKELISRNYQQMLKAAREDAFAKAEEIRLRKQHNPGTPKPGADPSAPKGDDVNQKILSALDGSFTRSNFLNRK